MQFREPVTVISNRSRLNASTGCRVPVWQCCCSSNHILFYDTKTRFTVIVCRCVGYIVSMCQPLYSEVEAKCGAAFVFCIVYLFT